MPSGTPLTPEQIRFIRESHKEKFIGQIAKELNISKKAVLNHLKKEAE